MQWTQNASTWTTTDKLYEIIPSSGGTFTMRCNTGTTTAPRWERVERFPALPDALTYEPLRYRCDEHGELDLTSPCRLPHRHGR